MDRVNSWRVEAVGDEVLLTLYYDEDAEIESATVVFTPQGASAIGQAFIHQAFFAHEVAGGGDTPI